MKLSTGALLPLSLALLAASAPAAVAQVEINARSATIRVGGRLHSQFATSSDEDGKSTDFFNRRARLTFDVTVSDYVDGRVQPDLSGGGADLKDAYFRLKFDPAFRVSFGQFKRAFDVFELDSSTEMVMVERTGRISGVSHCAGVGSVCSLSRFTESLRYSDRDAGIRFDGALSERVSYLATVTNGTGTRGSDENSGKSISGRLSVDLDNGLVLSGNIGGHDYTDADDNDRTGVAYGVDLVWGSFRDGTNVRLGLVTGDNWREDDNASGDSPSFMAVQGVWSNYTPVDHHIFEAIEPIARLSWGDPDMDSADDTGLLLTPGLNAYVSGRNRIGVNLDVYRPNGLDTQYSFKVQTSLYF